MDEGGPWLDSELTGALRLANEMVPAVVPLELAGLGRFQGSYDGAGRALNALLLVRLVLHGLAEVRGGVAAGPGQGPGDAERRALAEALAEAGRREGARATPGGWRTTVAADPGLDGVAMFRDLVLSRMDERDVLLVLALLEGSTVTAAAGAVGISQQAASRRLQQNGGYALLRSWRQVERAESGSLRSSSKSDRTSSVRGASWE